MMSKKQPWFKFWAFDWLSSPTITLMTLAERGALISLLAHIWGSGRCCIPDDQQQAMILSGWTNAGVECASGSFDTVWDTLIMMPGMPGFLTHPKLLEQHELTKARSAAGKQNGSKRQAKRKQNESKTKAKRKQTSSKRYLYLILYLILVLYLFLILVLDLGLREPPKTNLA